MIQRSGTLPQIDVHGAPGRDRIKASILLPFTVVLVFVIGVFVSVTYVSDKQDRERRLTESVQAFEKMFGHEVEKDASMMRAVLDSVTRNEKIRGIFLSGDRQGLLEETRPLFENLKWNNNITHFYFTGAGRVNFLRVHQPDRHGDVIGRITTLWSEITGNSAYGIELGPLGTFTLRVVMPWRNDERLIGYVELGMEIKPITKEIHRILGVDLMVLVYKKFLDREQWETGRRMLGYQADWTRFPTTVVVGSTMNEIPRPLIEILEKPEHPHDTSLQVKRGNVLLLLIFKPLFDAAGTELGDLILIRDVTALHREFLDDMMLTTSLSILAGIVGFALFYFILDRVEKDYRRQRAVESELSRLTTEHRKIVQVEKLSAMGMMIGEIAHQMNNPLVGVVNMAQLAERKAEDPERTRRLLAKIRKSGEDCRAFIQRMLEFTRISNFERQSTDLKRLIRETITLFRQSAKGHPPVVTELVKTPVTVGIDPILIRHALFNLLTNASQADPAGGAITVRLFPETRDEDGHAGWRLSVIDQGPGIPPEIIDNIFTPFFSTRPEGTGLGLPVVQHVAVMHDGSVAAENHPGGGACFAIWLPNND